MCRSINLTTIYPRNAFAILLVLLMIVVDQHGALAWLSFRGSRCTRGCSRSGVGIGNHKYHATVSYTLSSAGNWILSCWNRSIPPRSLFGTAQNEQIDSCCSSSTMITPNDIHSSPLRSTDLKNLMATLLDRFCGDFDNYRQVVQDRKNGLLPREGGGHEHIHAVFVPVTQHARLAAFYFDGNPNALFRFRYYHFVPFVSSSPENSELVDTYLYTLSPDLYSKVSNAPPVEWSRLFREHLKLLGDENGVDDIFSGATEDDGGYGDLTQMALHLGAIQNLPRCEVRWSWEIDPVQHSYVDMKQSASSDDRTSNNDDGIHAVMVHGEATVVSSSPNSPGRKILIRDQLSLYELLFYIHDRGWDPDTMEYIYGNQRGVPYILERVTRRYANGTMISVDPDLSWTIGSAYRSNEEYQQYMDQVGGPSIRPAPTNSSTTK